MQSFWLDEKGATAIEYALIMTLVGMAIIGALGAVYGAINSLYINIENAI